MKRKFLASWEGPIAGYATNFVRKSSWRCNGWQEEDLLQEAYLVYLVVKKNYANQVDNSKWFMALYKTALNNRIIDIQRQCVVFEKLEELEKPYEADHELLILLTQAKGEVKEILEVLLESQAESLRHVFDDYQQTIGGKKFHGNKFFNYLLKTKKQIDIVTPLKRFILEGKTGYERVRLNKI